MKDLISVIITTYNWPASLKLVLQSLQEQTQQNFEVIIADDGSDSNTKELIDQLRSHLNFPIKHIWQEDDGFQAAKIRNKAAAKAQGEYLIFLDGDCVVPKNFIFKHQKFSELGYFLSGNRILLAQQFTNEVLQQDLAIYEWNFWQWWSAHRKSYCNRILPLLSLPDGRFRKLTKTRWRGVKTCNLGLWRQDFIAVNGFDEEFSGWGYEDSDLIIRLIKKGIKHKNGRFALPVFHLWHAEQDRSKAQNNFEKLKQSQAGSEQANKGIAQYLNKDMMK